MLGPDTMPQGHAKPLLCLASLADTFSPLLWSSVHNLFQVIVPCADDNGSIWPLHKLAAPDECLQIAPCFRSSSKVDPDGWLDNPAASRPLKIDNEQRAWCSLDDVVPTPGAALLKRTVCMVEMKVG